MYSSFPVSAIKTVEPSLHLALIFETLFKDYPVLFVDSYFDITKELLIENNYLYQQAQTMDLGGLTLPYFYDKIVEDGLSQ